MLCFSPTPTHLHLHLHHLHHHRPPARHAAATCKSTRGLGVTLCLRTPTTPEERRQRRRVARLHDASAASAAPTAPALKPPETAPAPALKPPEDAAPAHPPTPSAERRGWLREMRRVWWVCGVGYWVQGFRCFPWLALNFHLARGLGLSPAALQLVQHTGSLPLVAKPLFGVLSDAVYIGGAHRLPYISIGALLQLIAWGTLAIIPVTGDTFPTQMACILIGNLGASITEVVSDAVVTEFSRTQKAGVLQSYAFIALAAGALLGNLSGGYVLLKTQEPKIMFTAFSVLLGFQLALSLSTKETLPSTPRNSRRRLVTSSLAANLHKQFSNFMMAISEERIFYPLTWIMTSFAVVPILSGTMFCFQTQYLKLDPSIIGLSKVMGQLMVLSLTVLYNRYLKRLPLRHLIAGVQMLYAVAVLSDLVLVKQINLMLGIPNEIHVLCFSALAEAIAQFKVLPFSVLLSSLCPPGCEGSLFAFCTSGLVCSAILSGVFGIGLSTLIGVSSVDYSNLPLGILLQSLAALLPLGWISFVPEKWNADEKLVMQR
ncbi:putative folate-biopterin transporter 9, chloroplastic [Dichanthelium oligosanthes]|uniref:Putative folate-biopterin transporter 9, chloroplastic n=1 Tax=Dichanthelium oligosanthes TaxID=888268 RepID=A0A1E5UU87_9POAL|nr:putative folate-biopterin transporter 9, chloroplastic [Dichanthelium oligosanthes]